MAVELYWGDFVQGIWKYKWYYHMYYTAIVTFPICFSLRREELNQADLFQGKPQKQHCTNLLALSQSWGEREDHVWLEILITYQKLFLITDLDNAKWKSYIFPHTVLRFYQARSLKHH